MALQNSQQGRQNWVFQESFLIFLQSLPLPNHPSDRACLQSANETHQVPDGTTEDDQQNATPSVFRTVTKSDRHQAGKKMVSTWLFASSKFHKRFLARSGFCSSLLFPVSSSDCLMRHSIDYLESQYYFFFVRKVVWKKKPRPMRTNCAEYLVLYFLIPTQFPLLEIQGNVCYSPEMLHNLQSCEISSKYEERYVEL